jgi:hypothetical protein
MLSFYLVESNEDFAHIPPQRQKFCHEGKGDFNHIANKILPYSIGTLIYIVLSIILRSRIFSPLRNIDLQEKLIFILAKSGKKNC